MIVNLSILFILSIPVYSSIRRRLRWSRTGLSAATTSEPIISASAKSAVTHSPIVSLLRQCLPPRYSDTALQNLVSACLVMRVTCAGCTPSIRAIELLAMTKLHPRAHEQCEPLTRQLLARPEVPKHRLSVNHPRLVQAQIRSMTAVMKISRSADHLRSHGVQVNVADELGEVLIVGAHRKT